MKSKKRKNPGFGEIVRETKTPRIAEHPNFPYSKPNWAVSMMEIYGEFGWGKIGRSDLDRVRKRLGNFEGMTWNEILIQGGGRHHPIPIPKISKAAKKRLEEIRQDDIEELMSLSLTGQERILGIRENSTLRLLWWDPEHRVCPSKMKHT